MSLRNFLFNAFSAKKILAATQDALVLPFIYLLCHSSIAQNVPKQYDPVAYDKRASFGKLPSNWTFADSIILHPAKNLPGQTFPGNQWLIGKPGEPVTLSFNGKNFRLYLSYKLSPKAVAKLNLPGGGFVMLSEGRPADLNNTNGFTGQFPAQDAGKAAGLIQTLELDYESNISGIPGKSRLNEVRINGIVVQQSQYITPSSNTPISIEVLNGTVVFRGIGLQNLELRKPVFLSDLQYKIYNDAWDSRKTDLLATAGKSAVLTQEVAEGKSTFNLVYEGDLHVTEDGEYDFTTIYTGAYCQLSINGNVVLDTDQSTSLESHHTNVPLEKGSYKLKIWYSKTPWLPAALGLMVGKKGVRAYSLHALSSLPEPPANPFIEVEPGFTRPEMVRSFIQLKNEAHKRTHCISVGTPFGKHYSIDLNRAAFLQVWSGKFANTTEMWYDRGEPQLLSTYGLTEPVSPRSSIARLSDASSLWPDSAAVRFLDYRLNKEGYPVFHYSLGNSFFEDAITAFEKGVKREISTTRNASPNNYALLAEGQNIILLDKGLYLVDGRFYVQINGNRVPVIRTSGGKKELIMPLSSPVSYSLTW